MQETAQRSGPSLVLGVDGGNTKTIAIVARQDGTVLGYGRAGCSDIYNAADEAVALNEIKTAVLGALDTANATAADIGTGAFSLAGADWPEDIALLERAVQEFGFGRKTKVVNDAIGALRAGTPGGIGVGVTCGTGIAIGAMDAAGQIWYSGHWPVAAGGAELGWRALRAVYAAHLGLAPCTAVTDGILEFFGVTSVEAVLHCTTARGTNWSAQQQAKLAPVLLDKAALGDHVALQLVVEAAAQHADAALAAAAAVGIRDQSFRLVLNGGVLRHPSQLLVRLIRERIVEMAPGVEIISDPPEPVVGAVLLAFDFLDHASSARMLERLLATIPGRDLFATS